MWFDTSIQKTYHGVTAPVYFIFYIFFIFLLVGVRDEIKREETRVNVVLFLMDYLAISTATDVVLVLQEQLEFV